jgi:glycosyltransferase involved in cell wall biosynthesis
MRVAVDTTFLLPQYRNTGTRLYLANLLSECLRISKTSEMGIEFLGFTPPGVRWNDNGLSSSLLSVRESWIAGHRRLWLLGGMALAASLERPDLLFLPTPHSSIPAPFGTVVTTIHDAMPYRLPPGVVECSRRMHRLNWINAKLASRVITVSSWSKQDLVEIFNLDPENVEVAYPGCDKRLFNPAPPDQGASAALLARLGIRKPFVLHHGMVQLRKNPIRLIQAWERVMEGPGGFDPQLVLAGPPGLGYEEVLKAVAASPYRERIILTGALPDPDLVTLIKNASLCVIPSLYEGFCSPMLESISCGIPTIVSKASCLPEVSGGVLEYFDPLSVEEMAAVLRRALEDSELRERLRRDGLTRAAEFTWERCARETLAIFAKTVSNHG